MLIYTLLVASRQLFSCNVAHINQMPSCLVPFKCLIAPKFVIVELNSEHTRFATVKGTFKVRNSNLHRLALNLPPSNERQCKFIRMIFNLF